jgi:signal transduction histidine kinase
VLEINQINASHLISSVVESITPAAEAKQISLRQNIAAGDNFIFGDAARLQQVLWNLLTNSIKFTPPGGSVEINLQREETSLVISVKDSGKGIDLEFLPHVFDRFRQADGTTTRHFGGLGLGLAIVRHLVEQHGGTVSVFSEGAGKGAIFTIKLPGVPFHQTVINQKNNNLESSENDTLNKLQV